MRWMLHGNLTPAVGEALKRRGDTINTPVELGIDAAAAADELFKTAHAKQLDVMTVDAGLAQAPFEQQIPFGRSLVFLQLEGGDVEQDDAVDRLFKRYKRLTPGRLYTVTASRVKIRQLPTKE